MTQNLSALLLVATFLSPHGHGDKKPKAPARAEVSGPQGGSSSVPSVVRAKDGTLHVVFVEGGHVWLASTKDQAPFGKAVAVNPTPEVVEDNGEGRPKLALGPPGVLYVAYSQNLEKPYTGHIRFSRSTDSGATFSAPITVNDDAGAVRGHQFEALVVAGNGDVTVAWVDKRDREAALAASKTYPGGALYVATSVDGGRTFGRSLRVKDNVCECCRIAGDTDASGDPVFLFRDILLEEGRQIRDHSFVRIHLGRPGPVTRASFDGWAVDGCPHHGPALSFAPDGRAHLVWYAGDGKKGRGLFYASTSDGGKTFTESMPLGTPGRSVYPHVLASRTNVVTAWLASEGGTTKVMVRTSTDGGKTFGEARSPLSTTSAFDHPFLVRDRETVLLSWFTDAEGLRLVEVR